MKKLLVLVLALALFVMPMAMAEEEAITITVAGYFFGPVDPERDVVTPAVEKMLLEKHGINVKLEPVYIENANYSDIISARLADISGETVPDVFLGQSANKIRTMYEQGVIRGWDYDFFKENAPVAAAFLEGGAVNGAQASEVDAWKKAAMIGDQMVVIPSMKPDGSMPYKQLIYRGDWIDNLGLTEDTLPMTIDEFVELMRRFTKEDPDGNGIDDTYGMSATGVKAIFGAFGIYNGFIGGSSYWFEKDGELFNADTSDQAKEALMILKDMYDEGLIDPEFVTGKEAVTGSYWALSNGLINGRYGVSALASIDHFRYKGVTGADDAGGRCMTEYWAVNGEDSTVYYGPWPAGEDGSYGYSIDSAISVVESAVYKASLSDEKLAVIFQILDAFASDDELYMLAKCGIENVHYVKDEAGNITSLLSSGEEENAVGIAAVRSLYGADRAYSELAYNIAFYNNPAIANRYKYFVKPQYDSYILNAVTSSDAIPSAANLQENLNVAVRDVAYIEFITGARSFDEWDAFVADYNAQGGETLFNEANAWYAAQ